MIHYSKDAIGKIKDKIFIKINHAVFSHYNGKKTNVI